MIAEIHIEYSDDTYDVIVTDESWEYIGSDIEASDIYDGEIYNKLLWVNKDNSKKL